MDVRQGRSGTYAITGGTITGTNAPYVIAASGVAFIKASSGTMGNNGAVSGLTALPKTYTEGAWLYLPAGAVAAGVPAAAAWLWFVGSSSTAGTVYNSTYTGGIPTVGITTAFATTGPGAFTGVTSNVTGPTYTMTGGSMGPNGIFICEDKISATSNANAKNYQVQWNGSGVIASVSPTQLNFVRREIVQNRGLVNAQVGGINNSAWWGLGSSGSGYVYASVNTAADVTVSRVIVTSAAATDNIIVEAFTDMVCYRA